MTRNFFSWRNYRCLTGFLLKSSSVMDFLGTKKDKQRKKVGGNNHELWQMLILMTLFIVPLGAILFEMTTRIYQPFKAIGQVETLVFLLMILIVILGVIFSLPAIINSLYFGEERNFLIGLPVKPMELVAAKLSVVALYEFALQSILTAIILVALGCSIGARSGKGEWGFWIGALAIEIILPMITLLLATIGGLLLVRFTNFFSNQEKLQKYSGVMSVTLIFIITFIFASLGGMNENNIVAFFELGQSWVINSLFVLFPYLKMLATGLITNNLFAWIAGLILIFVLSLITYFLIKKIYLTAMKNLSEAQSDRQILTEKKLTKKIKTHQATSAYRRRDWLFIWRTPSFFNATILINLLWPLIIWILLQGVKVESILNYFNWSDEANRAILILVNLTFAFLIAGSNSVAATAISREGKNWFWLKIIPLNYTRQIWQKLLLAILISLGGYSLFLGAVYPILGLPIMSLVLTLALGFLVIVLVCSLGVMIDLRRPKFFFDETQNAIHQNYNNYLTMTLASFLALVVALGSIFLFQKNIFDVNNLFIFWTLIIAGLAIMISSLAIHFGGRRLSIIEGE